MQAGALLRWSSWPSGSQDLAGGFADTAIPTTHAARDGRFAPLAVAVSNIARWDEAAGEWTSPGSGIVGNWLYDLSLHVCAGGYFRLAGDKSSIGVAYFSALTTVFADGFE